MYVASPFIDCTKADIYHSTNQPQNLTINSEDSLTGNHVPLLPQVVRSTQIPASAPAPTFVVTVDPILTATDAFTPVAPATIHTIIAALVQSTDGSLIDFLLSGGF